MEEIEGYSISNSIPAVGLHNSSSIAVYSAFFLQLSFQEGVSGTDDESGGMFGNPKWKDTCGYTDSGGVSLLC